MKLFIAIALLTAATAGTAFAGSPPADKRSGWVTDSMCAEKHAGADKKDVACVTKCIKGGAHPVFVDDASKNVLTIDNPDAVKAFYGEHIDVDTRSGSAASSIYVMKAKSIGD